MFGQEEALGIYFLLRKCLLITLSLSHLFRYRQASLWPQKQVDRHLATKMEAGFRKKPILKRLSR